MTPVVLAHLGGVPEAATVAVPMLLLGAILYAGRRRDRGQDGDEVGAEGAAQPGAADDDRDDDLSR